MPIVLRPAARPPPTLPAPPHAPALLPPGTYLGYLAGWSAERAAPSRAGEPPVERVELVLTLLGPPAYAGQRVTRRYYLDSVGAADFARLLRTLLPPAYRALAQQPYASAACCATLGPLVCGQRLLVRLYQGRDRQGCPVTRVGALLPETAAHWPAPRSSPAGARPDAFGGVRPRWRWPRRLVIRPLRLSCGAVLTLLCAAGLLALLGCALTVQALAGLGSRL